MQERGVPIWCAGEVIPSWSNFASSRSSVFLRASSSVMMEAFGLPPLSLPGWIGTMSPLASDHRPDECERSTNRLGVTRWLVIGILECSGELKGWKTAGGARRLPPPGRQPSSFSHHATLCDEAPIVAVIFITAFRITVPDKSRFRVRRNHAPPDLWITLLPI